LYTRYDACVGDNVSFETVYLKFYEVCTARISCSLYIVMADPGGWGMHPPQAPTLHDNSGHL